MLRIAAWSPTGAPAMPFRKSKTTAALVTVRAEPPALLVKTNRPTGLLSASLNWAKVTEFWACAPVAPSVAARPRANAHRRGNLVARVLIIGIPPRGRWGEGDVAEEEGVRLLVAVQG